MTNGGVLIGGPGSFTNLDSATGTLKGGTFILNNGSVVLNGVNGGASESITDNAAVISLAGTSAGFFDQNGDNLLAGLARNTGTFLVGMTEDPFFFDIPAAKFTKSGTVTVGGGSTFNLTVATATYTQTAGTTTVDGTLTAKGGIKFSGGSVFGNGGTLVGNVKSSGNFNIGDAVAQAGEESITGTYTQTSKGVLNIDIGGTAAGTQFDQLNISGAASLNGTLNLDLINSFVPTVGETFHILNAGSVAGTFPTVNGTSINENEHFAVLYNSDSVTLDVVSGP